MFLVLGMVTHLWSQWSGGCSKSLKLCWVSVRLWGENVYHFLNPQSFREKNKPAVAHSGISYKEYLLLLSFNNFSPALAFSNEYVSWHRFALFNSASWICRFMSFDKWGDIFGCFLNTSHTSWISRTLFSVQIECVPQACHWYGLWSCRSLLSLYGTLLFVSTWLFNSIIFS